MNFRLDGEGRGERSPRPSSLVLAVVLIVIAAVVGSCSALLEADAGLAERAHITVEGTTGGPLLMVTSVRFTAVWDARTGQYSATLLSADTVLVSVLPYAATHRLTDRDRFLVRLINPDSAVEASVRMQIQLDGRLVYTENASLRNASLEYLTYFQPPRGP